MEVIRDYTLFLNWNIGILHVCGGDPQSTLEWIQAMLYSPRMWRWSFGYHSVRWQRKVFSTYVEVIPMWQSKNHLDHCILHVCGGDPLHYYTKHGGKRYSPRMWRWSYMPYIQAAVEAVFSTYVEVIPIFLALTKRLCRILHVCGGDPDRILTY